MMAKLTVIERGSEREVWLEHETTYIGRDDVNEITLKDASVSRRHCTIEKKTDGFFISDLESLNGTFVNDQPADNLKLAQGDKIRVGDFTLLFSERETYGETLSRSSTVVLNESRLDLSKSISRSFDEIIGAMARDFAALMQIATQINSIRDTSKLQEVLLKQVLQVVPATEAAILLSDAVGDIVSACGLNANGDAKDVNVSRTILGRSLKENRAILANDIATDETFNQAESLFVTPVFSVLCVPVAIFEKNTGALYVSSHRAGVKFDETHLRFLTAIAGIAAVALENARSVEFLESENTRLREENFGERNMLGASPVMEKIYAFIKKAAPTESTVLINGESGTGKELAARAIHLNSRRADKPFVAVNCAVLTENLLESELFGHERGSFTGAVSQKKGKIEMAAGGTLFLDEIGEIPLALQAKILRVLQEREFERVGGTKVIKTDARIIAATNRHLEAEVKTGNFREDLFYRLNVLRLTMPPLRERKEDVLVLAEKFVRKYAQKMNRRLRGISAKAKKVLLNYDYPGNVRELENAIERAVVLGAEEWLLPEDLPENFLETAREQDTSLGNTALNYQQAIRLLKKELIFKAYAEARGSYVETAKILDVHPNYLHRLIRNLGIKEELEKSS